MNKTYRHVPLAPDEYLGHVDGDGRTYEARFGLDKLVGRVDIGDGKIYESRLGPDKYIGRVELNTGKLFQARLGPDEYLGRVRKDGRCYLHRSMQRDIYLGRVKELASFAHGGAAMLLLLVPVSEKVQQRKDQEGLAKAKAVVNQSGAAPQNQA